MMIIATGVTGSIALTAAPARFVGTAPVDLAIRA